VCHLTNYPWWWRQRQAPKYWCIIPMNVWEDLNSHYILHYTLTAQFSGRVLVAFWYLKHSYALIGNGHCSFHIWMSISATSCHLKVGNEHVTTALAFIRKVPSSNPCPRSSWLFQENAGTISWIISRPLPAGSSPIQYSLSSNYSTLYCLNAGHGSRAV
jgi:hypothetical protein